MTVAFVFWFLASGDSEHKRAAEALRAAAAGFIKRNDGQVRDLLARAHLCDPLPRVSRRRGCPSLEFPRTDSQTGIFTKVALSLILQLTF